MLDLIWNRGHLVAGNVSSIESSGRSSIWAARSVMSKQHVRLADAHRAPLLPCGVTFGAEVPPPVAETVSASGTIDILVDNAGQAASFDAAEMSEDDCDSVFAVDVKGVAGVPARPADHARGRSRQHRQRPSIHARMTNAGASSVRRRRIRGRPTPDTSISSSSNSARRCASRRPWQRSPVPSRTWSWRGGVPTGRTILLNPK
jgi:NAD(P)-dependent dehydrogenase (short-subunit alcohol dehydrogenase family)